MYKLRPSDETTIVNALRVAAEIYDDSAGTVRDDDQNGDVSVAEQFDRQAKEARELAERIEADGLTDD